MSVVENSRFTLVLNVESWRFGTNYHKRTGRFRSECCILQDAKYSESRTEGIELKKAAKKITTSIVKVTLKKMTKKAPSKKIATNSPPKTIKNVPKSTISAETKFADLFELITTTLKQTEKVL